MTSVCIVGHDTCINILIFRINTAETVFAAWRIKASVTADLDHAVSQPTEEPNERRKLCYKFRLGQLQQYKEF